jgi:hypothetical protein
MAQDQCLYTFDGSKLGIVPSSTTISKEVPPGTYTFCYDQRIGLWVEKCSDVPDVPVRVYGSASSRLAKVYRAFDRRPRNTGVLLSGEAGMGKSLFIRMMAAEAKRRNMPIFIINADLPGIVQWLKKCSSHALVILDEFEKVFRKDVPGQDEVPNQDKFLSLLDGMDDGKKLYVAAINETYNLNKYMINRPGRFLYHFTFGFLSQREIVEYMEDKLVDKSQLGFLSTALLGHRINYDALSCIIDEVNAGEDPKETLQDVNLDREDAAKQDFTIELNAIKFVWKNWKPHCGQLTQAATLDAHDFTGNTIARVCATWDIRDMIATGSSKYTTKLTVPGDKLSFSTDGHANCFRDWTAESVKTAFKEITDRSDLVIEPHYEYSGYGYVGMDGDARVKPASAYRNEHVQREALPRPRFTLAGGDSNA